MLDVGRCAAELRALGARIGRLALATGVDVSRDDNVVMVITGGHSGASPAASAHALTQLRALLMLWYSQELVCLERFGAERGTQLIAVAEQELRRRGFAGIGARAGALLTRSSATGPAGRHTTGAPALLEPARAVV